LFRIGQFFYPRAVFYPPPPSFPPAVPRDAPQRPPPPSPPPPLPPRPAMEAAAKEGAAKAARAAGSPLFGLTRKLPYSKQIGLTRTYLPRVNPRQICHIGLTLRNLFRTGHFNNINIYIYITGSDGKDIWPRDGRVNVKSDEDLAVVSPEGSADFVNFVVTRAVD